MASSGGPVTLCCVPIGSGIVTSFSKTGISLPGFKLWLLACKANTLPLSQLRNILLFHLNNLKVLGYGSRATAPLVKYIHCIKWGMLSFSHTINCLHLIMHVTRKNIFAKKKVQECHIDLLEWYNLWFIIYFMSITCTLYQRCDDWQLYHLSY